MEVINKLGGGDEASQREVEVMTAALADPTVWLRERCCTPAGQATGPRASEKRRGWDSNPRVTLTATAGFQDRCGLGNPKLWNRIFLSTQASCSGVSEPVRRRVSSRSALPAVTPRRRESAQH